jgi:hypothetical protein
MAQAFIDHFEVETLGVTANLKAANMAHIVMEVLGYFKFGTIDIQLIVTEVLGKTPNQSLTFIDHFTAETIGQWAGF